LFALSSISAGVLQVCADAIFRLSVSAASAVLNRLYKIFNSSFQPLLSFSTIGFTKSRVSAGVLQVCADAIFFRLRIYLLFEKCSFIGSLLRNCWLQNDLAATCFGGVGRRVGYLCFRFYQQSCSSSWKEHSMYWQSYYLQLFFLKILDFINLTCLSISSPVCQRHYQLRSRFKGQAIYLICFL
jgi:hypothetical protein